MTKKELFNLAIEVLTEEEQSEVYIQNEEIRRIILKLHEAAKLLEDAAL